MTDPAAAGATNSFRDRFAQPIFIVSTPRSGSTLLFETLAQSPRLFSIAGESHFLIEGLTPLNLQNRGWTSNRLTATDATPDVVEQLAQRFYRALKDRDGGAPHGRVRMLEKTPKNALRVEFFGAAWPDSRFIYLYRDPRQTMASMIEAWASGRFRTYPGLPGWTGYPWSMLLVPGWRELVGKPLPEIVAKQWAITTDILIRDLQQLPPSRVYALRYDALLNSPTAVMKHLSQWASLDWDRDLGSDLPLAAYTVSHPAPDKWKRLEGVIEQVFPIVAAADQNARYFLEAMRQKTPL